jgi:hypothetical protein
MNRNRKLIIDTKTLKKIKDYMTKSISRNVTHIHKYLCETTRAYKYCNAIPNKEGNKNSGKDGYIKFFFDEITEEWLYHNYVQLNKCQDWYNRITDKSRGNVTFEVPAASCNHSEKIPPRIAKCPIVLYPQKNEGTCGISALSSAFAFTFEEEMAVEIFKYKEMYLKVLSNPVKKTKKSSAMIFLMQIMEKKPFSKSFECKRLNNVQLNELKNKNEYFYSVILCFLRSTKMSRDHIIAFSQGWIFDSNLDYAIDFSDDNLNWCVGKGKEHEVFGGFHEVVQFRKRIPRKKRKK